MAKNLQSSLDDELVTFFAFLICLIPWYNFILEEELHRLPRQQGSSAAYLLQTAFDTAHIHYHVSHKYLLSFLLLLLTILHCAIWPYPIFLFVFFFLVVFSGLFYNKFEVELCDEDQRMFSAVFSDSLSESVSQDRPTDEFPSDELIF